MGFYNMKNKRKLPKGYTWFLLVFGLVWLGYTIFGLYENYQSSTWNSTTGEITSVKIESTSYQRGGTKYHYSAVVSYNYTVNNKWFTGSNLSSMPIVYNSATAMQNLLQERGISKGESVAVYYKPSDASQAALIVDHRSSTTMQWIICMFLVMCITGAILELMGKLSI